MNFQNKHMHVSEKLYSIVAERDYSKKYANKKINIQTLKWNILISIIG